MASSADAWKELQVNFPEGKVVLRSGGSEVWSRFGWQELSWLKIRGGKRPEGQKCSWDSLARPSVGAELWELRGK